MRSDILSADSFLDDPFGGKGSLILNRPDKRVWIMEDPHTPGLWHQSTLTCIDPLLEANKAELTESNGKTFGDGKVIGRLPLDIWFRKMLPAKQQGDTAWIKRFWNDPDNRAFRSFRGNI
jgi:hypothetical protein